MNRAALVGLAAATAAVGCTDWKAARAEYCRNHSAQEDCLDAGPATGSDAGRQVGFGTPLVLSWARLSGSLGSDYATDLRLDPVGARLLVAGRVGGLADLGDGRVLAVSHTAGFVALYATDGGLSDGMALDCASTNDSYPSFIEHADFIDGGIAAAGTCVGGSPKVHLLDGGGFPAPDGGPAGEVDPFVAVWGPAGLRYRAFGVTAPDYAYSSRFVGLAYDGVALFAAANPTFGSVWLGLPSPSEPVVARVDPGDLSGQEWLSYGCGPGVTDVTVEAVAAGAGGRVLAAFTSGPTVGAPCRFLVDGGNPTGISSGTINPGKHRYLADVTTRYSANRTDLASVPGLPDGGTSESRVRLVAFGADTAFVAGEFVGQLYASPNNTFTQTRSTLFVARVKTAIGQIDALNVFVPAPGARAWVGGLALDLSKPSSPTVWITGGLEGALLQADGGSLLEAAGGETDAFLLSLKGNALTPDRGMTFGGPECDTEGRALAVDGADLYLAGSARPATAAGASCSFAGQSLAATGGDDVLLAKLRAP